MPKPRAVVLGGPIKRPRRVFPDRKARRAVCEALQELGNTDLSEFSLRERVGGIREIEKIVGLYLGAHAAGPPPKYSDRDAFWARIRTSARSILEQIEEADDRERRQIFHVEQLRSSTAAVDADLFRLCRQLDNLSLIDPADCREGWLNTLEQRITELLELIQSAHASNRDLLHRAMRRRAEEQGPNRALPVDEHLKVLLCARPDQLRLPEPSMDQPANWLILDLASVWERATGTYPLRRMLLKKNDDLEDPSTGEAGSAMSQEEYDKMVDAAAVREEVILFANWVRLIVDKAGGVPPSIRQVRRLISLNRTA